MCIRLSALSASYLLFEVPLLKLNVRGLKKILSERMWEVISKDDASPVNKAEKFQVSTEMVDEMELHQKENLFIQEAFKSRRWDKEDQSV